MRNVSGVVVLILVLLGLNGCVAPQVNLFRDGTAPLREFTIQGRGGPKILVVSIRGVISNEPDEKIFGGARPSLLQDTVAQLRRAGDDPNIRALVLKIESPGGSVTASDILYHEIVAYKEKTGVPVVAALMDLATSGGYYVALPADHIVAHPTTVTGSIGVVFMHPKVGGLMDKLGLGLEVNKSGVNKDMASPFRESTPAERKMLQTLTEELGQRFMDLVIRHRRLEADHLADIASARVYLAAQALEYNLVDQIGYLDAALAEARKLTGLPEDARVVVYRRTEYADDTLYNTATVHAGGRPEALVNLGLPRAVTSPPAGFYYLWAPAGL
jgi:protease-4